jgi:hypothetical protein
MFAALRTLTVEILALTFLLTVLFSLPVGIWIVFSIRRSLNRIADALEGARIGNYTPLQEPNENPAPINIEAERRIANSLFGR